MKRKEIKELIQTALLTGIIIGIIIGGIIGYLFGANKLPKIQLQDECQWVECNCPNKTDYYHCTTHGNSHDCDN